MELNLGEAAKALSISKSTARRWIQKGTMKADLREGKHGPEYVIQDEEIERLLAQDSDRSSKEKRDHQIEQLVLTVQTLEVVVLSLEMHIDFLENRMGHLMSDLQKQVASTEENLQLAIDRSAKHSHILRQESMGQFQQLETLINQLALDSTFQNQQIHNVVTNLASKMEQKKRWW